MLGKRSAAKISGKLLSEMNTEEKEEMKKEAQKAFDERISDRKNKILEFMRREGSFDQALATCGLEQGENKPGVMRREIEKLLNVSDETARKYLNELEKEGRIKQVGESGPEVSYVLNN